MMTENTQAHKTRNTGNCYKLFHVLLDVWMLILIGNAVIYSCFFFSITCQLLTCSFSSEIIRPPRSVNVAFNETAVFTCIAVGSIIIFEVNNQTIDSVLRNRGFDDSSPEVFVNNTLTRVLRVLGTYENNASEVYCLVFQVDELPFSFEKSSAAILLVVEQGVLHIVLNMLVLNSIYCTLFHNHPYNLTHSVTNMAGAAEQVTSSESVLSNFRTSKSGMSCIVETTPCFVRR